MVDGFIFGKIAKKKFEQRLIEYDGELLVRVGRKSAIRVSRAEWDALVRDYRRRVGRANWMIWAAILLQLPNIALADYLYHHTWAVHALFDGLDAIIGGLSVFCVLVWLPFAALALHERRVARVTKALIERIAQQPRVDISGLSNLRKLQTAEILVLILFGPGVFVDLYGTIYPTAFDYSPYADRHLTWTSMIGLAAFVTVIVMDTRRRRAAAAFAKAGGTRPSLPTLPRRYDPLARAHVTPQPAD